MIQIKRLNKSYGKQKVVNDVDIVIEKNKITSLIGANGAGKSTLFLLITRLLNKDNGEIIIESKNIESLTKKELSKKIAILLQTNNISMRLTVRDLVSYGRFPHSEGRLTQVDKKHIDEAIEYMNLGEFENRYLDELSGGQRQRAYIAMAIAQDTEYIFLDEPLNNLDMPHAIKMMKMLRHLCDEHKKTIILVMHDVNYTSAYSDNIIAMKKGSVVKSGSVDEVIDESVLSKVYDDMSFKVREIDNKKVCLYY